MHRIVVALAALTACSDPRPERTPPEDSDLPGTTDSSTSEPVETGGDTSPPADTDTGPTIDCSVLPPVPAPVTILKNMLGAEDFDFDLDGYQVAVQDGNLVGRNRYGDSKLVATGVASSGSGTRVMHDGTWLVADSGQGVLRRIDPVTGAKTVLYVGSFPNGIEVDGDDVYLTDFSLGRVMRFNVNDPQGDSELIDDDIETPNGVVLSPDKQTLYVALSFVSGIVAYDRQPDGTWGDRRTFHTDVENQSYQGINVDLCGNVYATGVDRIVRVPPDGSRIDLVSQGTYLPNIRWGPDVGGFDQTVLYAIDWFGAELWALDIGIPGEPHEMAP